ncbi:hypothetical protein F4819DRAFT_451606 [Hypoxylon fuscum]|nr:hypothetical protein F4819DRAFT_451606 [Hypoxylon fuscum]
MPLHLLGKKSWNVYNPKNVERVKRDEAAAKEREEAEEQRQQEVDAERRLAILRGEVPPPLPPTSSAVDDEAPSRKRDRDEDPATSTRSGERRKRKRTGEDDTDFELRLARERTGAAQTTSDALVKSRSNAPLTDHAGHIDLFPEERTRMHSQKNEEAEKEAAKKKREYEDHYMMRFSNAAGKEGIVGAWYAKGGDMKDGNLEAPSKDVWGNEDPRRKEREAVRVVSNDPLAMMKRGAAKVREVEKERRQLNEERERELKRLRKEEKRRERQRKREGRNDYDDLNGFSLDGATSSRPPAHPRDDRDDRGRQQRRHSRDEGERPQRHSEHKERRHDDQHRSSRSDHRDKDRDKDRDRGLSKHDRRRLGKADHY